MIVYQSINRIFISRQSEKGSIHKYTACNKTSAASVFVRYPRCHVHRLVLVNKLLVLFSDQSILFTVIKHFAQYLIILIDCCCVHAVPSKDLSLTVHEVKTKSDVKTSQQSNKQQASTKETTKC